VRTLSGDEGSSDPDCYSLMKPTFRNTFASLWSRPDPVLAQASVAGELLVAKIRLGLATVLLIIPVIDSLFFPVEPKEAIVGVSLTAATFLLSAGCLFSDLA